MCFSVLPFTVLRFTVSTSKSITIFQDTTKLFPRKSLKVNNRNSVTRCKVCSKLTKKTPERCHWRSSGVFIVTFEHISHRVLVFLFLTLNM